MKKRFEFCFAIVRQFLLALVWLSCAGAEELPPAPVNHIYDPDFLVSRKIATELGAGLARFEKQNEITVYLAVYSTTPRLIGETAAALNEAWNQSGYGVVIVFAPLRRESRVLPSPQLSLEADADSITQIFQDAAQRALNRGDYSAATVDGTAAVMQNLLEVRARATAPARPGWHPSRPFLLAILALVALVGGALLWISAQVWRSANLFDHRYRFPETKEPAALRFGATRCGGQMATIEFSEKLKAKDV